MRSIVSSALVLFILGAIGSREAKGEDVNTANEVICDLQYKNSGFRLSLSAKTSTSIRETKGPDFGGRTVKRGEIYSGEPNDKPILIAWDKTKGNLYLDLNGDLDINDANEVFSTGKSRAYYFSDMSIMRQFGKVSVPYVIDAFLYSGTYYNFTVQSGFEGTVLLGGKSWRVSFADNMNGTAGEGDYFAITPADSNCRESQNAPEYSAPKEVFADGRNWALSYEFLEANGQTQLRVKFNKTDKPMGKARIEGEFDYLTLKDKRSLVMLDRPVEEIEMPLGQYLIQQVCLDGGKNGLFERRNIQRALSINVKKDEIVAIKVGGPLSNNVEIKRVGRVLNFYYILKGIDGQTYRPTDTNEKDAPKFEIYRGNSLIGSGTFRYG